MYNGIGRGRARGRGRQLNKPGSGAGNIKWENNHSSEEEENWDDGIETPGSIKSVVYTPENKAIFLTPRQPTASSSIPLPREKESNQASTSSNSSSVKPPVQYGPPIDEDDHYEDDSDDELYSGWDLGSHKEPFRRSDSPEESQQHVESDFDRLLKNNPDVSPAWLASIHAKEKKDNEVDNRAKSSSKEHMWRDVRIFTAATMNEAKCWNEKLQRFWQSVGCQMSQLMVQQFRECMNTVSNPYTLVLYVIESSPDYMSAKSSTFSNTIAREFEKWSRDSNMQHILDEYGPPLQLYAFYVGSRFHVTSFEAIVKAFKLAYSGNDFLVTYIRPMLDQKKIKEAMHCIARLGLHDYFNTEELVFPMIVQDKINLVESYVFQKKKQQIELLKLLDHLTDDKTDVDKMAEESGVEDIKYDKLTKKLLGKLAIRLMKLYEIDQDICPNIDNRRRLSALRFLIYKFYEEETLPRENWRELVESSVAGNTWLQAELVDEILSRSDLNEAVWWARKCNLADVLLPVQVVEAMEEDLASEVEAAGGGDTEDWEEELLTKPLYYHSLKLSFSEIHFIDNREDYLNFIDYVTENADVIGLDAEWRPSFGQESVTKVALLQVACLDRAFLLDIPVLNQDLSQRDWFLFGSEIFMNEKILKLGYGFEADIKMIVKTIPAFKDAFKNSKRVVELSKIQDVVRSNPKAFQCEDITETYPFFKVAKSDERGLSDLVRRCFGRPLDKGEQMSDWEKRPLRRAQAVYAALDAYVLIELHGKITETCEKAGIECDLEPRVTSKARPHLSRLQRKQMRVAEKTAVQKEMAEKRPPRREGPPIRPRDLAVVVDNMIQGMGRYLRSCGVDVAQLTHTENHDAAAKIAVEENRVILTCGAPFHALSSQVPEGMCYHVLNNVKPREQAIDVLDHYNIKVTKKDIFSRCMVCNGNVYLHISPADMRKAWDRESVLVKERGDTVPLPRKVPPVTYPSKPRHTDLSNVQFDPVDLDNVTIANGVHLQVSALPREVTFQVPLFYCCAKCGKVFWEGKHFEDMCTQFSDVLNRYPEEDEENLPNPDLASAFKGKLTFK